MANFQNDKEHFIKSGVLHDPAGCKICTVDSHPRDFSPWRTWSTNPASVAFVFHSDRVPGAIVRFACEHRLGQSGATHFYWYAAQRHGRKVVKASAGNVKTATLTTLERAAVRVAQQDFAGEPALSEQDSKELGAALSEALRRRRRRQVAQAAQNRRRLHQPPPVASDPARDPGDGPAEQLGLFGDDTGESYYGGGG